MCGAYGNITHVRASRRTRASRGAIMQNDMAIEIPCHITHIAYVHVVHVCVFCEWIVCD